MQRSSVDLPEPDAPMMHVTSPFATVKSTSRRTDVYKRQAQLYVREECRGKNAGTALLIFLSQRAKALGCGMLTLTASPVNLRVEPFLERNGFVRAMRWYTHPLH